MALPSSLPGCTIIDAVMNNLYMFNDIGLFNDKGALSDQFSFERRYPGRINVNAVSFILNEMDHMWFEWIKIWTLHLLWIYLKGKWEEGKGWLSYLIAQYFYRISKMTSRHWFLSVSFVTYSIAISFSWEILCDNGKPFPERDIWINSNEEDTINLMF